MKKLFETKKRICMVFREAFLLVLFIVSGHLLSAKTSTLKDSVLVVQKHGRDKVYYKACGGYDALLIYSLQTNTVKILSDGDAGMRPLIKTLNDIVCSEKSNLMYMIEIIDAKRRGIYLEINKKNNL